MLALSRQRRVLDIWPGFVDGLAALLMVVIFVLLLFSIGEFFLTDALVGRDQALDRLRANIAQLTETLGLERSERASTEEKLVLAQTELQATVAERDEVAARLEAMSQRAEAALAEGRRLGTELEETLAMVAARERTIEQQRDTITGFETDLAALQATEEELKQSLARSQQETSQQEELTQAARSEVERLNQQISALREQLLQVGQALEASESTVEEQSVQIEDLGRRLNLALAQKVEELSQYRSEFFGRLREALKDNPDIRVEGDRFVLPSEVLFPSASAELDKSGKRQIKTVAQTLKAISSEIPEDIDWVLRVDGHTDRRPIRVAFPSNWELSAARAISIVKYMIQQGVPKDRLVAAGFGEHHPIDPGDSAEALRKNRRIELKLTSR
jgi:chemotaxis protein MotB